MIELTLQIIATLVCATLFGIATQKMLGVMQQGGYKNGAFWKWLFKKGNMFINRLCVLAYSIAMSVCVAALCFSFLGVRAARLISAIPFFTFLIAFLFADRKYALKVPEKRTGRLIRLQCVYMLCTAVFFAGVILLLGFLSKVNGSDIYALIAYVPFALAIVCLPLILMLVNAITSSYQSFSKDCVIKALNQLGFSETVRGERLSTSDFAALSDLLYEAKEGFSSK